MSRSLARRILLCVLSLGLTAAVLRAQAPPAPSAADEAVPKDLRVLLQPRQSELRLVTARYTLDRATLGGNYLGAPRAFGRGPGASVPPVEPLSPNRVARLKRFDLDWKAALSGVAAASLSPAGRADLDALSRAIDGNLKSLDAEAEAMARVMPLVPFAPTVVQLVEARIRMEDVNPEKAAAALTRLAADVGRARAGLEAGLSGGAPAGAVRVGKDAASRGPAAVETLSGALQEWFAFYNGYDPLFTWWNGVPFRKADAALQAYSAFVKEKIAGADGVTAGAAPASAAIAPAAPPKFPSVPDLKELIALPQDEMTDIVQRFRGVAAGGGREGRGGESARGAKRGRPFYEAWLKALETLDFDGLSRNAQVDYLYIRRTAQLQIARAGVSLPGDAPRKADSSGIPGKARGRQGLVFDLQDELIPYSPEELVALAEREFAWCEAEMTRASRQLGLGDDWKAALERVKEIHPPPGGQAAVVRDLMFEAVDYLRARDLLTVPGVAAESLHMIMMTPERQLVNPFFTGGSEISVSYPTDAMDYDARQQSMRGNNTPFSHATAFHEMIPGHNLVYYTGARYRGYRPSLGGTPFYGEGWPLYWELTMYDAGFHDTPEKRVGALFWRMHRSARIIFSLKFHLGDWSPQECVDFLVDRVGFERDNAVGEVRRSFQGGYGPLYQAAYLLGGLQLRALRKELVDSGQAGEKAFHDEVLRQGSMPIALLRLAVGRQKLTRTTSLDWKYYGEHPGAGPRD